MPVLRLSGAAELTDHLFGRIGVDSEKEISDQPEHGYADAATGHHPAHAATIFDVAVFPPAHPSHDASGVFARRPVQRTR